MLFKRRRLQKSPKRPTRCNFFNTSGSKSIISVVTASCCPCSKRFFLLFGTLDLIFRGAFLSVLLEGFAVGQLNAVVGVHVDEGFGLLLFGAFNHKLDFLFSFSTIEMEEQ